MSDILRGCWDYLHEYIIVIWNLTDSTWHHMFCNFLMATMLEYILYSLMHVNNGLEEIPTSGGHHIWLCIFYCVCMILPINLIVTVYLYLSIYCYLYTLLLRELQVQRCWTSHPVETVSPPPIHHCKHVTTRTATAAPLPHSGINTVANILGCSIS